MKINPYTEKQKQFILEHHGKLCRKDMAKKLNVNIIYVTAWAIELTGEKREMNKRVKVVPEEKEGIFYHDKNLATI